MLVLKTLSNDEPCGSRSCGLSVESVWLLLIDTLEEINNQLCCSNECTALPLTFESNIALTSTLLLYDMGYCAVDSVCPPDVLYHSQPCGLLSLRTSMKVVCFLSVPMKVLYIPPLQIYLIHSVYRTLVLCSLSSINAITSSHVLSMNRNADCLFKRKNGRCASVCLYVHSYTRTTVFWML